MKNSKSTSNNYNYKEKRCPECFAYLKLNANKCVACGLSVGNIDKHGLAKRHINWKAYLTFVVSAVVLGLYIWKTFL